MNPKAADCPAGIGLPGTGIAIKDGTMETAIGHGVNAARRTGEADEGTADGEETVM
jgi:hypothetical protein